MNLKKRKIILCVDDENVILQSLKSQLKDLVGSKFILEVAETGDSALEIMEEILAEGNEIPLMVVDYLMPGMKGDQLLIDVHARSPSTLCIMLTGQADLSAVANAINHEALFRYMSKPWNKEDLVKTIEEAFHRHELEKNVIEKQKQLEAQNIELAALNIKLQEKNELFYRFVPVEFLKILNMSADYIQLGESCQKKIVVLFTDIRSFTDKTQHLNSNETFEFINQFTQVISPIIKSYGGFIDKFIGDAVLSIFLDVNDCLSAIFEVLEVFKNAPKDQKIHNLSLGFSLNYGDVQLGTVGYSGRMETTILGKVVNIAAKIEKLNKIYNTKIILTEEVCKAADKEKFTFVFVDDSLIPGIDAPMKLYTVSLKEAGNG